MNKKDLLDYAIQKLKQLQDDIDGLDAINLSLVDEQDGQTGIYINLKLKHDTGAIKGLYEDIVDPIEKVEKERQAIIKANKNK